MGSAVIFAFHVESNKRSIPVYVSTSVDEAATRILASAAAIAPKVLRIPVGYNSGNSDSCQCPREYARGNKVPSGAEVGE